MKPINGCSAIGYGFDALKPYGPGALKYQVFTQTYTQGKQYKGFDVPDNIAVQDWSPERGGTQVFQSQYSLQEYLSIMAGVEGSYCGFSGQIDVSYSSALSEWGSCFYALTNAFVTNWMLTIMSASQAQLTPPPSSDFLTELNNLPAEFDLSNPTPFFEFFHKWGTHYVSGVGVGGYFCYYEGVINNGSYSVQEVQANAELEYNAVFVDAGVSSQADWQRLTANWAGSRQVSIMALGGSDPQTLSNLDPIYGTSAASSYQNWLKSVQDDPSEAQFFLRGWDDLFASGSPQQQALQDALQSYLNYGLYVSATISDIAPLANNQETRATANTVVLGNAVIPAVWPPQPTWRQSGIQVVVIDNQSMAETFAGLYYFSDPNGDNWQQLYNQLMNDLESVPFIGQWCCCAVFNYPFTIVPDERFIQWLNQFGITATTWLNNYANCTLATAFNYVAIGLGGSKYVRESGSLGFPFSGTGPAPPLVNEAGVNPFLALRG